MARQPQPSCRAFGETGKQVCGRFLDYWVSHGGLQQQGYPISGEFSETSRTDGKVYTVQYFERAVFEYHPEKAGTPYEVLLSLLGVSELKRRYPNGAPEQPLPANPGPSQFFPQTGKSVYGLFLDYWNTHGGLQQQGYPISNRLLETSELNGKQYQVQYFERAVFEYHPENPSPYNVLLSQLGTSELKRRYPNGVPGAGGPPPSPAATATPKPQADIWATLAQRPLKLPAPNPVGKCAATPGKIFAGEFGPGLGDGPVYPVGFGMEGKIDLAGALRDAGGYYTKVLWVSQPDYLKPVLVRGGQLGAAQPVLFGKGESPQAELRLDPGGSSLSAQGYHQWMTYTRLRGSGCYAYQMDSPDFSKTFTFWAIQTMP